MRDTMKRRFKYYERSKTHRNLDRVSVCRLSTEQLQHNTAQRYPMCRTKQRSVTLCATKHSAALPYVPQNTAQRYHVPQNTAQRYPMCHTTQRSVTLCATKHSAALPYVPYNTKQRYHVPHNTA